MCGRPSIARNSKFGPGRNLRVEREGSGGSTNLDKESMSPGARITAAMSILGPVMLSGLFLVVFVPQLWWIFTTYAWISFPAFGLLASGIAGVASIPSKKQVERNLTESKERELLRALWNHGELMPTQAAIETSLSVSEADEKLKELAEDGHLEVRVRGGGLFYALWESEEVGEMRKPTSLQMERRQKESLGT